MYDFVFILLVLVLFEIESAYEGNARLAFLDDTFGNELYLMPVLFKLCADQVFDLKQLIP